MTESLTATLAIYVVTKRHDGEPGGPEVTLFFPSESHPHSPPRFPLNTGGIMASHVAFGWTDEDVCKAAAQALRNLADGLEASDDLGIERYARAIREARIGTQDPQEVQRDPDPDGTRPRDPS